MCLETSTLFHVWHRCNACDARPIIGRRFECLTCPAGPDSDFCESCYELFKAGQMQHPRPETIGSQPDSSPHSFRVIEGQYSYQDCVPWLTVAQPVIRSPEVPERFVVRPEFRSGRESFFGTYGFAVELESGERLVLTALHLLDEILKKESIDCSPSNFRYTGEELPHVINETRLYDPYEAKWMLSRLGTAGPMLVLPHARVGEEEPYSQHDIAAFRADPAARISYGRLADRPPDVGDPIWLAARSSQGSAGRTIAAVVVEQTERTLIFRYEKAASVPLLTSGAPLIDHQGRVVGINIGSGWVEGYRTGHAHHVGSIRKHLGTAGPV